MLGSETAGTGPSLYNQRKGSVQPRVSAVDRLQRTGLDESLARAWEGWRGRSFGCHLIEPSDDTQPATWVALVPHCHQGHQNFHEIDLTCLHFSCLFPRCFWPLRQFGLTQRCGCLLGSKRVHVAEVSGCRALMVDRLLSSWVKFGTTHTAGTRVATQ